MKKMTKYSIFAATALVFVCAACALVAWRMASQKAHTSSLPTATRPAPLTWDEAEQLIARQSDSGSDLTGKAVPLVRAGEVDYLGTRCYLFYRVLSDAPVFIEDDFLDPTQPTASRPFEQSLPDVECPDSETPPDYATHKYYVGMYGDKFVELSLERNTKLRPLEAELAPSTSSSGTASIPPPDSSAPSANIESSLQAEPAALVDEMTVRVVDPDGNPVANIGVYVNPPQKSPLVMVQSRSISSGDGIAVLQRVRSTWEATETTVIGLCDRNQSDTIQQTLSLAISADSVTPVNLVWTGETPTAFCKRQPDRVVLRFHDEQGTPIEGLLINVSEIEQIANAAEPSPFDNPEMVIGDLNLSDKAFYTNQNGEVTWVGLTAGTYSVSANDGRPDFNNVASDHPRLQLPLTTSQSYEFDYSGNGIITLDYVWKTVS